MPMSPNNGPAALALQMARLKTHRFSGSVRFGSVRPVRAGAERYGENSAPTAPSFPSPFDEFTPQRQYCSLLCTPQHVLLHLMQALPPHWRPKGPYHQPSVLGAGLSLKGPSTARS